MKERNMPLLLLVSLLAAPLLAACRAPAIPVAEPLATTPIPDTPTPQPEAQALPTHTPSPPPKSPVPGGKCGDGVCDQVEKNDPNLCPQDCVEATVPVVGTTPLPATGAPDYEPPINVFLVLHIDPAMDLGGETFQANPVIYARTHDEIDWLMVEAERHSLHFTALYNGWYPQWALKEGDTGQFRTLLDAGHEIGSHTHRLTYDSAQDLWISHVEEVDRYGRPHYDAALANQCWADADRYVDAALDDIGAAGQNQTMCAVPFKCSDEGQLMQEFGFTIAAGNRSEKGSSYFGHMVWNPWRPATSDEPGFELAEDPQARYVALDHLAQIGSDESHGMDLSVPQLQRRFLMLYAEWLARERTGAEDRVWAFGFVYHPNYGDRYNAELAQFLSWLDEHFVGKTSPQGHTIARYATIGEIAQEFIAWEAAHPGASSFNYVRDDPYPYTYATMPTKLEGAAYEAHVDLGQGVSCFRLAKDGQPIYLLWSDVGERTVDLSAHLGGQVRVTDSAGGQSAQDASALHLTEAPLFVEPLE
jgi:hypothetical protein